MNRNFLTEGEEFDAEDFCNNAKNPYIASSKLAQAILGSNTLLNAFTCTQNSPAGLSVIVSAGEIYQMAEVDETPFGALPTDDNQILKQGINLDQTILTGFTAPVTPGQSVYYLIEMALQTEDELPENRSFWEAADQVVDTQRQDSVLIQFKAGTPSASPTIPAVDLGFVGAFVISIDYGQTTITNGDIVLYSGAPFIANVLGDMLTEAVANTLYAPIATATCKLGQVSGTQNVSVGSATKYITDTVVTDPYSFWNATNKRFIAPFAGIFRVGIINSMTAGGSIPFDATVTVYKNGAQVARLFEGSSSGKDLADSGSAPLSLQTGDYIELYLTSFQNTVTNNVAFYFEYLGLA